MSKNFPKSTPLWILVLVFVVTLVVSTWLLSPKFGRKSNLIMRGGSQIAYLYKEKSDPRSVQAFHNRLHSVPHPISLPSLIFKFGFLQYFVLYSIAKTSSVTKKTSTKFQRGMMPLIKNFDETYRIVNYVLYLYR